MSHPLTMKAMERAAKALAEACNGGKWETHYTDDQKFLWFQRVVAALEHTHASETKDH